MLIQYFKVCAISVYLNIPILMGCFQVFLVMNTYVKSYVCTDLLNQRISAFYFVLMLHLFI